VQSMMRLRMVPAEFLCRNPEVTMKGKKKKWLIVALAGLLAGLTAAGQAGIVPPVVPQLVAAVVGAVVPPEAEPTS